VFGQPRLLESSESQSQSSKSGHMSLFTVNLFLAGVHHSSDSSDLNPMAQIRVKHRSHSRSLKGQSSQNILEKYLNTGLQGPYSFVYSVSTLRSLQTLNSSAPLGCPTACLCCHSKYATTPCMLCRLRVQSHRVSGRKGRMKFGFGGQDVLRYFFWFHRNFFDNCCHPTEKLASGTTFLFSFHACFCFCVVVGKS
jgi:hypothetical protein